MKRRSRHLLALLMPLFLHCSLRADVTLVTTFESGGAAGVDVSGSNQWRIHGSQARWDRWMSAKDKRHPFPLMLQDRSCLLADSRREVIKDINLDNGELKEIAFAEWKTYADKQHQDENPFLDPASVQTPATHGRFTIIPSSETTLLRGYACRKIAYDLSYDVKEAGLRSRKRCRILTTFWMADPTPASRQAKAEVDGFFRVFEQKTGDRARFANPLTLGSHAWADGNAGTASDLAELMTRLEDEVRKLEGIPVKTEMETSLDQQPVFWCRIDLNTLSTAELPAGVFRPRPGQGDAP